MFNPSLVDFDQLNLVANNDPDDRMFLISIYLKATENDLRLLKTAIETKAAADVYRLSRGCAGASLSYGMIAMVPSLKQLETEAHEGNLENAAALMEQIESQFQSLQTFLLTVPSDIEQLKAA
jgi:hypothetical protein